MNDKAEAVLAEMMQRVLDGVDKAVDFSQAQIPDVVNQLLVWHAVESLIWFLLGVASVALCIKVAWGTKSSIKKARIAHEKKETWTTMGYGVTSIHYDIASSGIHRAALSFVLLLMGIYMINFTWLKIWIAPKLYLLEYGASLIK